MISASYVYNLFSVSPETSAMVQPVIPEVAKRYLEEYYHRLEERSRMRIVQLRKKKKRAVSFSQADQHKMNNHVWNTKELSRSVSSHHKRMSVDVDLLVGHSKTLSVHQPESPPAIQCTDSAIDIERGECVDGSLISSSQIPTLTFTTEAATKPRKAHKKNWKAGLLKRFMSDPAYFPSEAEVPPSPAVQLSKQQSSPILNLQFKLSRSRQGSFRQSDSELEEDLVIGNPSNNFSFPVVGTGQGEVDPGWPSTGHTMTRLSSPPQPIQRCIHTDSEGDSPTVD